MKLCIGDKVRRLNDGHGILKTGDTGTIIGVKESSYCSECDGEHLLLKGDHNGYSHCQGNVELVEKLSTQPHQVGTIFSILNEKEAKPYIGRMVEHLDNEDYRDDPEDWDKGAFKRINKDSNYPFEVDGTSWHLIRLIPESLEEPKPKIDPGLIEALKKSIQQWQIMYDTDKIKEEVYKFLGGTNTVSACFLCDFVGKKGNNTSRRHKCLDWKGAYCYDNSASPFQSYRSDNYSKPAMLEMLTHLKAELVRLESK